MQLPALAVTAITDLVLACEAFFVSALLFARPQKPWSAAWCWQLALFILACSALVGGIDHGFFEVYSPPSLRQVIAHLNWALIGLLTFFTLRSISAQFFCSAWQKCVNIVAIFQLLTYLILLLMVDDYLFVILNYAPVLFLLLGCNLVYRRKEGSWAMITGILLTLIASGIQAASPFTISSIDNSGIYHLGIMAALVFFYRGGLKLKGFIPTELQKYSGDG